MPVPHKILIVEDEPLIAMMLEDFLGALGHSVVGICDTIGEAMGAVEQGGFDLAILDVNVNGETIWPVARKLSADGLPFILATGGHVEAPPEEFASAVLLEKPYTMDGLRPVIDAAMTVA